MTTPAQRTPRKAVKAMKPVEAWAVLMPRSLHSILGVLPTLRWLDGTSAWMFPIYRIRREAERESGKWKGMNCRVVPVLITELPPAARQRRGR